MLFLRKNASEFTGSVKLFGSVLVLGQKSDLRLTPEDASAGRHEKRVRVSTGVAVINLGDLLQKRNDL